MADSAPALFEETVCDSPKSPVVARRNIAKALGADNLFLDVPRAQRSRSNSTASDRSFRSDTSSTSLMFVNHADFRDEIVTRVDDDSCQPWMHGVLSREDVEARLKGRSPGTFCVRLSAKSSDMVLCVVGHKEKIIHFKIVGSSRDGYSLDTSKRSMFQSVDMLIEHYHFQAPSSTSPVLTDACPRPRVK
jgi:hypothetical protein